jgi:hypothetical protein
LPSKILAKFPDVRSASVRIVSGEARDSPMMPVNTFHKGRMWKDAALLSVTLLAPREAGLFDRSGYIPKIIGILLVIDGLGWVIDSLRPYFVRTHILD